MDRRMSRVVVRGCLCCRCLDGMGLRRRFWSGLRLWCRPLRQMNGDTRNPIARIPNFDRRPAPLAVRPKSDLCSIVENRPLAQTFAVVATWDLSGILGQLVVEIPDLLGRREHVDALVLTGWKRIDNLMDILGVLHRQRLRARGVFEIANQIVNTLIRCGTDTRIRLGLGLLLLRRLRWGAWWRWRCLLGWGWGGQGVSGVAGVQRRLLWRGGRQVGCGGSGCT